MTNTALSAKAKQIAQNVTFRDDEYRKFSYLSAKLQIWRWRNVALVYCLGIDVDIRRNVKALYFMTLRQVVSKRSACIMVGLQAEVQGLSARRSIFITMVRRVCMIMMILRFS